MRSQNTTTTIGRAAKQAGIGVETVRFYERRGLIAQPPKPAAGGFRDYPGETVARSRSIRQAQAIGFSSCEIGQLLSLRADPSTDGSAVRARAVAQLAEADRQIAQLG